VPTVAQTSQPRAAHPARIMERQRLCCKASRCEGPWTSGRDAEAPLRWSASCDVLAALATTRLQEPLLTFGLGPQSCRSAERSESGGFSPTEASCLSHRPFQLAAADPSITAKSGPFGVGCWSGSAFAAKHRDARSLGPLGGSRGSSFVAPQ
jgi:hypothetical protein